MAESQEVHETLAASFRQARKEFWFMIATWATFAAWTLTYNGLRASAEGPVEIVWGMPSWVVFGVALPWAVATGLTIWFSLAFMKDTPLEEITEAADTRDEEGGE